MLSPSDLATMQREQYKHDMQSHFDIISLHKADRLKHYGLHFAKYVGRIARGSAEPKPLKRTLVDAVLISLSAANALDQDLSKEELTPPPSNTQIDSFRTFAEAVGRFADACEKIDHLEDFLSIARKANRDVIAWLISESRAKDINLHEAICARRKELCMRFIYIG